uniref:Integrase, catalytic region, zinc finger, CCHC-type, peptidase aspartic, catalytic n=1 Tax=Tanacetum cinerariifolium TaxID=118510 RepID=A0A699GHE5_TANCI|nr:integrase, catalytic region, zinc finger, CCHC-type, peptidase aspartic, catalytic [Tanacetum cinerariifolium]
MTINLDSLGIKGRKPKRVKDSAYHKEKMLLCNQVEKGVPLQAEQYDWLADTDEEINEQELEAHYSYMNDQNDVESDEECVALTNLIANLKLNVDENKEIQKQLKKANTTLAQTSNVNAVCGTCKKCLVDSDHFACVTKMLNEVYPRTKNPKVVLISTRQPKGHANKSVATPHKKKVASNFTTQKPKSYYWMLYEKTSKAWKWGIEQQCPSRYKWVPKKKMQWVPKAKNENVQKRVDGENLDKMKEKGDPCILVGYSTKSNGYRVYNKRTRLIVESFNIHFDEIKEMLETSVTNDTLGLVP